MREIALTDLPEWEALRAATEGLYEVFSSYPLRPNIPRCTHCVTDEDDARLRAKPLRELTENELRIILYNLGTWGDEVDFKHFLPRLFEFVSLEIAGQPITLDCEMLGRRVQIEEAGFAAWPASERAALTSFCLAWWRATLAAWPHIPFILNGRTEAILCAIAQFTDDLAPYLAVWRQALGAVELRVSLASVAHLLVLVSQQATPPSWLTPHKPNSWWEDRLQQWRQARAWIEDPETASVAQRTLRRAHGLGVATDARWFDAEAPEYVAPALEWIASLTQDA